MRHKPFASLLACSSALLTAMSCTLTAPQAGDPSPPARVDLQDPGFESPASAAPTVGWHIEGQPGQGTSIRLDETERHSGRSSVLLHALQPASLTLSSDPVDLKVGRVYRLTGWIKTDQAVSDPEARYPTAVPACMTMASFPFTNHSPAVGATSDWTRVDTRFVATRTRDRVRLHLGLNGAATGKAWFDDLELQEVAELQEYVAWETVRWAGDGYRYDDQGWIFVHVEGKPYERGYQLGYLVSPEIAQYISKVAQQDNAKEPVYAWNNLRLLADAEMLRKYDEEYLTEMKGIADGAARGGAKYDGRSVDLIDVVALNSLIDLGQLKSGLKVTAHALTGQSFLSAEEEMKIPDDKHKCSAFTATGPATSDGKVVFGQIFMWAGYTGVHFNLIVDLLPSKGHRVVYQTFPGGIHSGTDFYINDAGIVIGETTVSQTPYDPAGTPQSNRVRRAAQYSGSLDAVARTLRSSNNGLYTNDWVLADVRRNEAAIFLLGTHKARMWRASDRSTPFDTPGFLWSVNNNRDPEVRREYAAHPEDAPYDLVVSPWNRDIAMKQFYQQNAGKIDAEAGVRMLASSPINRPHACDGKLTTAEMAERMVFLAHQGKVTLREKFPVKDSRRMPDLPGAVPHLSHGYATVSPLFISEQLKRTRSVRAPVQPAAPWKEPTTDIDAVKERYEVDKKKLWHGTVVPASDAENWFISGTAAYWNLLHGMADEADKAVRPVGDQLAELNARLLYVTSREKDFPPVRATVVQDAYAQYQVPRIKGTFALHQLRLRLGNDLFFRVMNELHRRWANKTARSEDLIKLASKIAGQELGPMLRQWIEREGLPDPRPAVHVDKAGDGWKVRVEVQQTAEPWYLLTSVAIDTGDKRLLKPFELSGAASTFELTVPVKPDRVVFNPSVDFPVPNDRFSSWANLADDFHHALIVYGTSRQIEANHTLALRWQSAIADAYTEILLPVVKDCEVTPEQLATRDLLVIGEAEDNSLLARVGTKVPVEMGRNWFRWQGRTYASSDDGLFAALPSPWNAKRTLYLFVSNSALQLHQMTKSYVPTLPGWAIYKGDEIKQQGQHAPERFSFLIDSKT
ncbi:MAG: hypothetical protein HY898_16365 [Deltaproteobacteria bacterium]|nr:hypothetical protein [Deltaproteobacteria bacterium]